MISNLQRIRVFREVVNGATVTAAAQSAGVSRNQARASMSRMCRWAGLPNDVEEMRKSPSKYLQWLQEFEGVEANELRDGLYRDLHRILQLQDSVELSPAYVANATASQLLKHGLSTGAVADVQEWLGKYSLTLKRANIFESADAREIRRAIHLLDAFGLDVTEARRQYQRITRDVDSKAQR